MNMHYRYLNDDFTGDCDSECECVLILHKLHSLNRLLLHWRFSLHGEACKDQYFQTKCEQAR